MKNKLLLKIFFWGTVTINVVCPPPTINQKRAQLAALIDWNNVDAPVTLNSLSFCFADTTQTFKMSPLCHAIALDDEELIKKLILYAGANIDGSTRGDSIAFVDGKYINLRPIIIARNNIPILNVLLGYGAKTLTLDEEKICRYWADDPNRIIQKKRWFNEQAYDLLLSYKINNEFNMRDPKVSDLIDFTMFGEYLLQLHDQCKFGSVLCSDEEKAIVKSKRQVFYDYLYNQSANESGRQKIKMLFNPTHFDENILVFLSILESENPDFGKNGEVSIRSRFGLE